MEFGLFELFIWLSLSVLSGVIASRKGRLGIVFFIISLVFSPLIGIISALFISKNNDVLDEQKISSGNYKKCPYCVEIVKKEAKVCRFCSKDLTKFEMKFPIDPEVFLEIKEKYKNGQGINEFSIRGTTPLIDAVVGNQIEVVKALLELGASAKVEYMGSSIQSLAHGNTEIIEVLRAYS